MSFSVRARLVFAAVVGRAIRQRAEDRQIENSFFFIILGIVKPLAIRLQIYEKFLNYHQKQYYFCVKKCRMSCTNPIYSALAVAALQRCS